MSTPHLYEDLAEILSYPTPSLGDAIARAKTALAARSPRTSEAAESLARLEQSLSPMDPGEREELYARTFDLNEARALDLGWQLFGETYKRGAFLVKMKTTVLAHGVDPGSELYDHLPVVLRLLPRLEASELPRDLVEEVILPSLGKILATFEAEAPGGYREALFATQTALLADFDIDHVPPLPIAPPAAPPGRRLPMIQGAFSRMEEIPS